MFVTLLYKECKAVLKSIIYFAFIGVVLLFYITQFDNAAKKDISMIENNELYDPNNPLMQPPENANDYGSKPAEIQEQIMPRTIVNLVNEYSNNNYTTYPIGFYKNVKLSEENQAEIAKILNEATGISVVEINEIITHVTEEYTKQHEGLVYAKIIDYSNAIPIVVKYEEFKVMMTKADKILGGGSGYAEHNYKRYGSTPVSYEEKLAEYNSFITDDKITGAYARLFCDYMGITIALFSVFVPVAFLMRDKRASAAELIYSRDISSMKIILARYCALIAMMFIPVLLLSLIPTFQLIGFAMENDLNADILAFAKYCIAWLLPTLLATTAVAFILTTLTDTPIAIVVQFLWGFISLMMGVSAIAGGKYGINLIVRHNSIGNLQIYKDGFWQLAINRIFYVLLSVVIISVTILIYEQKRRGRIDVVSGIRKMFGNYKNAN